MCLVGFRQFLIAQHFSQVVVDRLTAEDWFANSEAKQESISTFNFSELCLLSLLASVIIGNRARKDKKIKNCFLIAFKFNFQ